MHQSIGKRSRATLLAGSSTRDQEKKQEVVHRYTNPAYCPPVLGLFSYGSNECCWI